MGNSSKRASRCRHRDQDAEDALRGWRSAKRRSPPQPTKKSGEPRKLPQQLKSNLMYFALYIFVSDNHVLQKWWLKMVTETSKSLCFSSTSFRSWKTPFPLEKSDITTFAAFPFNLSTAKRIWNFFEHSLYKFRLCLLTYAWFRKRRPWRESIGALLWNGCQVGPLWPGGTSQQGQCPAGTRRRGEGTWMLLGRRAVGRVLCRGTVQPGARLQEIEALPGRAAVLQQA